MKSLIPVAVPHKYVKRFSNATESCVLITADLIFIAFYCSLFASKYTKPRLVKCGGDLPRATRTIQFSFLCVGFFQNNQILPKSSPLKILLTATAATLWISSQKNGFMGICIHHESMGKDTSTNNPLFL